MIYWERVNPVIRVTLSTSIPWQALMHSQRGDTGWSAVRGEHPLWWSDEMPGPQAARVIRENMVPGVSYLVIYGGTALAVQFVLLRGLDLPESLGVVPPDWWTDSPLVGRLLHVNSRATQLREAFRNRAHSSVDRRSSVEGYCSMCGLPGAKHVAHDPPDVAPPGLNQEKVADWLYALSRHYGQALKELTDEELLRMPDINNIRRLRLIAHEIEYRLKKPVFPDQSTIPSWWDRLLVRDF